MFAKNGYVGEGDCIFRISDGEGDHVSIDMPQTFELIDKVGELFILAAIAFEWEVDDINAWENYSQPFEFLLTEISMEFYRNENNKNMGHYGTAVVFILNRAKEQVLTLQANKEKSSEEKRILLHLPTTRILGHELATFTYELICDGVIDFETSLNGQAILNKYNALQSSIEKRKALMWADSYLKKMVSKNASPEVDEMELYVDFWEAICEFEGYEKAFVRIFGLIRGGL